MHEKFKNSRRDKTDMLGKIGESGEVKIFF